MIRKIFFVIFCSISIARLCLGQPRTKNDDPKWHYIGSAKGVERWYDSSTFKKKGSHCFVWIKEIPIPDSLLMVRFAKFDLHTFDKKWLKYAYSLVRWEINCEEDLIRLMSTVSYDTDATLIENLEFNESDVGFKSSIPGSIGETILKKFCN